MLDKFLVAVSLVALVAFCGVVLGFVAEPDLVIITVLVLALAINDFWITVFRSPQPSTLDPNADLEDRPTGVSGKPVKSGSANK